MPKKCKVSKAAKKRAVNAAKSKKTLPGLLPGIGLGSTKNFPKTRKGKSKR